MHERRSALKHRACANNTPIVTHMQVLLVDAPWVFGPAWEVIRPLMRKYAALVRGKGGTLPITWMPCLPFDRVPFEAFTPRENVCTELPYPLQRPGDSHD